jgi:hypothetical protein
MKIIILILLFNIFCTNLNAQTKEFQEKENFERLSISVDLETILSQNVFVNLLYEKKYRDRLSFLYGVEYQKKYSSINVNGRIISLSDHNFYYLKSKFHYYVVPFNEKQSKLNGLYFGGSLKLGGGNRNSGYYKVIDVSPGILIGTCITLSNKITLSTELNIDGYIEWQKEANGDEGFKYFGTTSYPNLWFSIGYRL